MFQINIMNKNYARFIFDNEWLQKYNLCVDDIIDSKTYPADHIAEMFSHAKKHLHITIDNQFFICRSQEKINNSTMFMDIEYKRTILQKLINCFN